MKDNKTPVIIAVLVGIIIVLAIVAVIIVTGNNQKKEKERLAHVEPVITLTVNTNEPDQDEVTITCIAETEDAEGISTITLPDSTTVSGDSKEYIVNKNDTYKFIATGMNGVSATKSITISNIKELSAENPYIPEGFEHIGGDASTAKNGFIISDKAGNEFVWVPVYNGILTRKRMLDTNFEENSGSAFELVNSVAKYYGFYIARYETSKYDLNGTAVASTRADQIPWTNINYEQALQSSQDMALAFGYNREEVSTGLISSYAWDTTLDWIDTKYTGYSTSTNFGNYSGTIVTSGKTPSDVVFNICDLAGNVREWTTEKDKSVATVDTEKKKNNNKEPEILKRVVRGGSATLSRTAASYIGYNEETVDNTWGFRMVLYKK